MCCYSVSSERAIRTLVLVTIGVVCFTGKMFAQKPSLEVHFKCDEPVYCSKFNAADHDKLRRYLAKELIDDLGKRFRCFQFVERGGSYRLVIELNRRERSPLLTEYDEVVFWISLTRKDGYPISGEIDWTFRPKEEYNLAIGDLEVFRMRLCLKLIGYLKSADERAKLTETLFGGIQVADRAFPIPGTSEWAMPFDSNESGIADGSQFQVKAHYLEEVGIKPRIYEVLASGTTKEESDDIPVDYRAKILGETLRPKGSWPTGLKVDSVFLIKYEPALPPMLQPTSPFPRGRSFSRVCLP